MAHIPLLALEKNRLDGPPGAKFAFGDEFDGALVNDQMWALGINEKNLQNEGSIVSTREKTLPSRMVCLFLPKSGNPCRSQARHGPKKPHLIILQAVCIPRWV